MGLFVCGGSRRRRRGSQSPATLHTSCSGHRALPAEAARPGTQDGTCLPGERALDARQAPTGLPHAFLTRLHNTRRVYGAPEALPLPRVDPRLTLSAARGRRRVPCAGGGPEFIQ